MNDPTVLLLDVTRKYLEPGPLLERLDAAGHRRLGAKQSLADSSKANVLRSLQESPELASHSRHNLNVSL